MMRTTLKNAVLAAAIVAVVGGCTTMVETRRAAGRDARMLEATAHNMRDARPASQAQPVTGPIITDAPYVDARPMPRATRYPVAFQRQVVMNEPMGVSLHTLAQRVEALSGVRVYYQSELTAPGTPRMGAVPATAAPMAMPGVTDSVIPGLPPLGQLLPQAAQAAMPASSVPIRHNGSVRDLLNAIATATNSHWEYDAPSNAVQFYRFKVELLRVPAVIGRSQSTAMIGGQSQQAGESTPMSQAMTESKHEATASMWDELDATMKQLVSAEGSYTINSITSTVIARDHPDRVNEIRRYLQDTADSLAKQVDVEVTIYRVLTSKGDTRAINWSGLFQNAAGRYGVALSTLGSRQPNLGGSTLSLTIPQFNADGQRNRFAGSGLIYDALSSIGNTHVVQNSSIITSNNRPAPFKVVRRVGYLKEIAQGMSQAGGIQTGPTLTPGTVETGLNLYVIPNVQRDGKRIQLHMTMSLSSLERMDSFGSTGAMIQLPQVSSREFQSEAWLNSGETLVLAGFEQTDSGQSSNGMFDAALWPFGGNSTVTKGREIVVIAIRPVVTAVRSRI